MQRDTLISHYKYFTRHWGLDPKDTVLSAGGALVMLGLREKTDDLDLDVPEEMYDRFLKEGFIETKFEKPYPGKLLAVSRFIDLHVRRDVDKMEIDGVWIYMPEELLKQKRKLNRRKDQEDIKKLIALLEE